jgi:hypothetical protein
VCLADKVAPLNCISAISMGNMNRTRIRRALPASILLAILISVPAAPAEPGTQSGDWPQFRGPNRDGKSTEQGLLFRWPAGGDNLLWCVQGVGKGGSVTFADGLLYCSSEDGPVGLLRPSPEKCDVVNSFKVSQGDGLHWAHLVVARGRLFLRHGTALMCHDLAAK